MQDWDLCQISGFMFCDLDPYLNPIFGAINQIKVLISNLCPSQLHMLLINRSLGIRIAVNCLMSWLDLDLT